MSDEKFKPDMAKILRETTPEKVAERRRKALEDFADAGGERAGAPSPWAKDGAAGIDPGTLPSAAGPKGEETAAYEVPKAAPEKKAGRRKGVPLWMMVAAVATVGLPVAITVVMSARSTDRKIAEAMASAKAAHVGAVPSATVAASATPSATPTATMVPSPMPLPSMTAQPSGSPAPPLKPPDRTTGTPNDRHGKAVPPRVPVIADAGPQEPVVSPDFVQ